MVDGFGAARVVARLRAALLSVRQHNSGASVPIHRLACPGLGTATGRVPLSEAARQMALAYRGIVDPPSRIDWEMASRRQTEIGLGGDLGFLLHSEREQPGPL